MNEIETILNKIVERLTQNSKDICFIYQAVNKLILSVGELNVRVKELELQLADKKGKTLH